MRVVSLIVLSAVISVASSARILAMLPFPGKSHYIYYSSILRALTQKGHHVVEYGPFPPKQPIPNYKHVEIHTSLEDMLKSWKYEEFISFLDEYSIFGQATLQTWGFLKQFCEDVLKHEKIQDLLHSDEKFDLVLTTSTFGQESMLAFGHKFQAPTITLQGFAYSSILDSPSGNVLSPATIPDTFSFLFTNEMSFTQRLQNTISVTTSLMYYHYKHLPYQDELLSKYYKAEGVPSVYEMATNVSLTFINACPGVEYPTPYTPNIVPIAGIAISPDRKPLPQDIKKFMDEAKDGVIYFSLGTNIPVHLLPNDVTQCFVRAFNRLPQRVLWKSDATHLPGLTDKIKLVKWVPQPGVLAHPNIKVFMTHGGLFSQQEAIHAGVPTIGMPFFADQPYNIKFNEHKGIGLGLRIKNITEEQIYTALRTILDNPRFHENAKRLSVMFRERPVSPADSVVFWTEHVLRHGGAHLRPASANMPFYQRALLDVVATLVFSISVVLLILKKALTWLLCRSQPPAPATKKKRQ